MEKSVFLAEIPESSWVSEPSSGQFVGKTFLEVVLGKKTSHLPETDKEFEKAIEWTRDG
ncbi:MAG: hypothetical protein ACXU99_15530 [Thermodesulfobacteriota bacterium]